MNLRKTTDLSRLLLRLRLVTFDLILPNTLMVRRVGSLVPAKARFFGPIGHP